MSLDEDTPSVAHHILAAVQTDGCAPNCGAYVDVQPRNIRGGSTGDVRFLVVPDDPTREPWDNWDCGPDCYTNAGFSHVFDPNECTGTPCVVGYTVEFESDHPIRFDLDITLRLTGPADSYDSDPPPGVSGRIDVE